ncbi:MAG: MIP/aquaporin family protein [Chthoniobacterales bacterium]
MKNPFIAELIGTMLLIIFGDGVVANVLINKSKGQNSGWIVIATGWAMAVAVGVYASWPISGAHINPAVTIGLAVIGKFPWAMVVPYIIAQMIGAFLGAVIVWLAYRKHFEVTENADFKLLVFCTEPAIRDYPANLVTEIIGTFTLLFGVLSMLFFIDPKQPWVGNSLGPWVVTVLIWAIGLSLGGPTGYAINPARDLGPRIAHALLPIPGKRDSDFAYGWIPVVGPIIGGIIGALLYAATFGSASAPH